VRVAADKAEIDTDRLAKVEAQTRVLADAVIAIADTGPSIAVGPAGLPLPQRCNDAWTAGRDKDRRIATQEYDLNVGAF